MGNDIFMGGIKFVPDFDNMGTQDQWYDFVGGAGKLQMGVAYQPSSARTPHSFAGAELFVLIRLPSHLGSIVNDRRL
jgi:hypothetical protein